MATDKDTHTATREAAMRTKSAAEEAARVGESTTRRAADAARTMAEATVDTSHRAAAEGMETSRKAIEAAAEMNQRGAQTTRDVLGTASDAAGRATGQFQRVLGLTGEAQGDVIHRTRENMDVMVQCSSVLADGFQSIMREWVGLAQEVATRNAKAVNTLMRSRTVPDFYATQSAMMKDSVELMLSRGVKISELSAQTANDAVRKLTNQAEKSAQETTRRF